MDESLRERRIVGSFCIACNRRFATRFAYDQHSTSPVLIGTQCYALQRQNSELTANRKSKGSHQYPTKPHSDGNMRGGSTALPPDIMTCLLGCLFKVNFFSNFSILIAYLVALTITIENDESYKMNSCFGNDIVLCLQFCAVIRTSDIDSYASLHC